MTRPDARSATAAPRIALFIRSLKGGGAERSTANLAAALLARGVAVDVVLVQATGPFLKTLPAGVRVVDLRVRSALRAWSLAGSRPADFLALLPLLLDVHAPRTLGAIPALARYLAERRPTALLSALDHGNVAAVIARDLAGTQTRIVLSQRNHLTSDIANARLPAVRRLAPIVRRFYPRADAVVAVSHGVADDLAVAAGLPRDRVRTIYNAVAGPELTAQASAPVPHPWFADGGPPIVLGVGKLKPQKDFATLIRAFAILRRGRAARLLILGEGPERSSLERLASQEGVADCVALPGFEPNPFAYMARADLFVLSSRFEGLPGVLIQALACGCPSVSTDCPSGPREILDGGLFGRLTPVGDPAALAEAMAATLNAPMNRARLTRRGDDFSFDRAADAYLDVLLGSEPPKAQTREPWRT